MIHNKDIIINHGSSFYCHLPLTLFTLLRLLIEICRCIIQDKYYIPINLANKIVSKTSCIYHDLHRIPLWDLSKRKKCKKIISHVPTGLGYKRRISMCV